MQGLVDLVSKLNLKMDGELLRLVSEALRIKLAHLFDPMVAVYTSMIEPLPHQITAVYGEMLSRQPLRFLLADDPGAGKTIMAGLLIKELIIRGDVGRCLVVCPGSLVDQWQDELYNRFQLPFQILTNDMIETAVTGNVLAEMPLVIARLDKLARDESLQAKLADTDWDLVICDEAHKMSASFFGGEIKETKRHKLGRLLGGLTRHFLLMTATPHNGKEEDFQLFMRLLDADRFEGRFKEGVHTIDVSDLMRRMVKEDLLRFDGTPLFPKRLAYTATYKMTPSEAQLYDKVTGYVREEFNRAESLENDGRKGTVGFALTVLQRRLASSPEAIYQSLKRRRERLEDRLRQESRKGLGSNLKEIRDLPQLTDEDLDDVDDLPSEEAEVLEELVVDQATAARTVGELTAEIGILKDLENFALRVRQSGSDRKWDELSELLQSSSMFDAEGNRRKIIIFTEHMDTLNYLTERIRTLFGRPEAVVNIHGGLSRRERLHTQELFTQDPRVEILVATDAAGEGINLQRAHLMVNYDLPWNPNRIEQRFGRIHRIGQTEVCHLWNLVADKTREGDVYLTLLRKLEIARQALGGGVFDVLGKAIGSVELRRLLIDAVRYGDRPEVKVRLERAVESALDQERLRSLIEEHALATESMGLSQIHKIREEMERAEARRLQPHFIQSFFLAAFKLLGGSIHEREPRRYEITYVPSVIRSRDQAVGTGLSVMLRYGRVCFEKGLVNISGKPPAVLLCPGHPLLDVTVSVILEKYRHLLEQGGVLVDDGDVGTRWRWLFYLEHSIESGKQIVSRRMQFVEIDADGTPSIAGSAPYLNYRALTEDEKLLMESAQNDIQLFEKAKLRAEAYALKEIAPAHYEEVRQRKLTLIEKTASAVRDRLTKEIYYWDNRAEELRLQEQEGKVNARISFKRARMRADELQERLEKRMRELDEEAHLVSLAPRVFGQVLVIPGGFLDVLAGSQELAEEDYQARETKRVEMVAMKAVFDAESTLGFVPKDVSAQKCGYDIESQLPSGGPLRFIEVKGRVLGADTVTVTKNEILTALNKPENFILAMVRVDGDQATGLRYVREPFGREPDFGVTSVNYSWNELWSRGKEPAHDQKETH